MKTRLVIAIAASLALCLLLAWQWQRERRVSACQARGGLWNGAVSRCQPLPGRPILQRDLQRT